MKFNKDKYDIFRLLVMSKFSDPHDICSKLITVLCYGGSYVEWFNKYPDGKEVKDRKQRMIKALNEINRKTNVAWSFDMFFDTNERED